MLADLDLDAFDARGLRAKPAIEAGFTQNVDAALLEHARAHAFFDVGAASCLDHDRFDAVQVQEMRQQQSRRTRPDDADLCAFAHSFSSCRFQRQVELNFQPCIKRVVRW